MIRSGVRLDEQAGAEDRRHARAIARRQRGPGPRWGVVNCPDGPHRVALGVVRQVMTRLLVAGELGYDVNTDLARKAGVSRSTVSRMLRGRPTGLKTVLAILRVLQLPIEDCISKDAMPDALAAVEDIAESAAFPTAAGR